MRELEGRLVAATERVSLAQLLVSQKEVSTTPSITPHVHYTLVLVMYRDLIYSDKMLCVCVQIVLRNSMATLEAERRWQVLTTTPVSPQPHPSSAAPTSSSSSLLAHSSPYKADYLLDNIDDTAHRDEGHDVHTTSVIPTGPYLSDLSLRPEAECLLRSLFRSIDTEDCGQVQVTLLHTCLGEATDADADGSSSGGVEGDEELSPSRQLHQVLRDGLGESLYTRLSGAVAELVTDSEQQSLSWGEVSTSIYRLYTYIYIYILNN